MKIKKGWKVVIAIFAMLLIGVGIFFWAFRSGVLFYGYEYRYTIQNTISPDGQRKAEVQVLGKENEAGSFPVDTPVNESYDICVRLWSDPETQADGAIMWSDVNTKIIYFKKDCTDLDVEWLDNDTLMIDGKEIDV